MDLTKQSILTSLQREFFESLTSNQEKNKQLLFKYFEKVSSLNHISPDIVDGDKYSWFNIPTNKKYLSLRDDLNDKIVIIDFFTYCCINCMHILPTLSLIEDKYGDAIGVIGVHSAKFDNEKVDENLAAAIERLSIKHPVVSDDMSIWRRMGIRCWPTVLVIGPGNKLLFVLTGEVYVNKYLDFFIETALEYFKSSPKPISNSTKEASKIARPSKSLKFPSTVKYSPNGQFFAIADAGNNRVVIVNASTRKVTEVIGSGIGGFEDGTFDESTLDSPQGHEWISDDEIIIADTKNHAIRLANLTSRTVKTIADIRKLTKSPHSRYSPWDCVLWSPDKLLISMAGSHQIWLMSLSADGIDQQICEGLDGLYSVAPFVGSGREENRNNTYRHRAGLAQPSGLFLDKEKLLLYFADSESSTVRIVDLNKGAAVSRLIGGAVDPMDLFAFGDTTGKDWEVKLQHPLGVAYSTKRKSVFVADTYNHKLKEIDVTKRVCQKVSVALNEPAGLTVTPDQNYLLVCNTNDHQLKLVNLDNLTGSLYEIDFSSLPLNNSDRKSGATNTLIDHSPRDTSSHFKVNLLQPLSIGVKFTTESDLKLNTSAPSNIILKNDPSSGIKIDSNSEKVTITNLSDATTIRVQLTGTEEDTSKPIQLTIVATVYLCSDSEGTCFRKQEKINFTILPEKEEKNNQLKNQVDLTCNLTKN